MVMYRPIQALMRTPAVPPPPPAAAFSYSTSISLPTPGEWVSGLRPTLEASLPTRKVKAFARVRRNAALAHPLSLSSTQPACEPNPALLVIPRDASLSPQSSAPISPAHSCALPDLGAQAEVQRLNELVEALKAQLEVRKTWVPPSDFTCSDSTGQGGLARELTKRAPTTLDEARVRINTLETQLLATRQSIAHHQEVEQGLQLSLELKSAALQKALEAR